MGAQSVKNIQLNFWSFLIKAFESVENFFNIKLILPDFFLNRRVSYVKKRKKNKLNLIDEDSL